MFSSIRSDVLKALQLRPNGCYNACRRDMLRTERNARLKKFGRIMDQQTQSRTNGSYTANLLGNIRSHLAGLQGYDVMALELIQNADDAKAEEIIFDITDRGLLVTNSSHFTYCGDLHSRPCPVKRARTTAVITIG